jgi:hypothetical protein
MIGDEVLHGKGQGSGFDVLTQPVRFQDRKQVLAFVGTDGLIVQVGSIACCARLAVAVDLDKLKSP